MIAFGCSVSEPDAYRLYAGPGIDRVKEPGAPVFAFSAVGSIFRTYNLLLDAAAKVPDLEAFVLVHPHAEITDPAFLTKVRAAVEDEDVAVLGALGARGVTSLAWWQGELVAGPVVHRHAEYGGGERPSHDWVGRPVAPPGDVDAVDGFLMVLSPWAVRTLRFDESLGLGHGFDLDICLQAKAHGKRVVVGDLALTQHRGLELISDLELWTEAYLRMAHKWPDVLGGADAPDGPQWQARARRAEAERECERAVAYGYALERDARILQLDRELETVTGTRSWRLTQPLRSLNKARADRRA
jgi:hypothetical protein